MGRYGVMWVAAVAGVSGLCVVALLTGVSSKQGVAGEKRVSASAAGQRSALDIVAHPDSLGSCERSLERAPRTLPVVAILGASYTAGVGPGNPAKSWAVMLARMLHWDAVVYGVPGAGYIRPGAGHRGPVERMLARIGLHALDPKLVILQFGHDDMGVRAGVERQRVEQAIAAIRARDPRARIALVTVFATRGHLSAAARADRVIVSAARRTDRAVIVMDPLAGHWVYPRARDGLHPTAAGDEWIARKVASILSANGVRAVTRPQRTPVVCDSGIEHRAL